MDGNYIKELGKDAFASAGLINLQKISMKNCQIQRIHEDAFSKLNILTEVNLGKIKIAGFLEIKLRNFSDTNLRIFSFNVCINCLCLPIIV